MSLLQLVVAQFQDLNLTENFKRISDYIEVQSLLHGFKVVEKEFDGVVTNAKIKHGLGFTPTDIVRISFTGTGDIVFNYDNFTPTEIDVTTTGPCAFRAFVGSYARRR